MPSQLIWVICSQVIPCHRKYISHPRPIPENWPEGGPETLRTSSWDAERNPLSLSQTFNTWSLGSLLSRVCTPRSLSPYFKIWPRGMLDTVATWSLQTLKANEANLCRDTKIHPEMILYLFESFSAVNL